MAYVHEPNIYNLDAPDTALYRWNVARDLIMTTLREHDVRSLNALDLKYIDHKAEQAPTDKDVLIDYCKVVIDGLYKIKDHLGPYEMREIAITK